jgi:hypothetical protein
MPLYTIRYTMSACEELYTLTDKLVESFNFSHLFTTVDSIDHADVWSAVDRFVSDELMKIKDAEDTEQDYDGNFKVIIDVGYHLSDFTLRDLDKQVQKAYRRGYENAVESATWSAQKCLVSDFKYELENAREDCGCNDITQCPVKKTEARFLEAN